MFNLSSLLIYAFKAINSQLHVDLAEFKNLRYIIISFQSKLFSNFSFLDQKYFWKLYSTTANHLEFIFFLSIIHNLISMSTRGSLY